MTLICVALGSLALPCDKIGLHVSYLETCSCLHVYVFLKGFKLGSFSNYKQE